MRIYDGELNFKRKLILAVDFDGTITNENCWYYANEIKPNAKEVINFLHDILNVEIIIWTCRDNYYFDGLNVAIDFLKYHDIHYDCINRNANIIIEKWKNDSRKIFADFYIDDKSFLYEPIDWLKIKDFIIKHKNKHKDKYI